MRCGPALRNRPASRRVRCGGWPEHAAMLDGLRPDSSTFPRGDAGRFVSSGRTGSTDARGVLRGLLLFLLVLPCAYGYAEDNPPGTVRFCTSYDGTYDGSKSCCNLKVIMWGPGTKWLLSRNNISHVHHIASICVLG